MNDAIVHFTIGTCPVITIFPFFILYNVHNRMTDEERENCKISFNTLCLGLPIAYGIIFAMVYSCLSVIPRKTKNTYTRFVVCGALSSLLISLILHYVFHIHDEWLNIQNPSMAHIGIFIFYLIAFYTIGQWLRSQILYGPSPKAPLSSSSIQLPSAPPSAVGKIHSPSVGSGSKFDAIAAKATK